MGIGASQVEKFPLKTRTTKKYGWKPELPDQRDIWVSFPRDKFQIKENIDLRNFLPEIYDQGNLGSCVSNALVAAFQFDQKKQKLPEFLPSRQFIYYNQRVIEGNINQDSGSSIRDGIKVLNRLGVCPEEDYPYNTEFFTERPNEKAYEDAQKNKAIQYKKIRPMINDVMLSLSAGIPVVFGFTVYESFESPDVERTGIMPMPRKDEKILGGHCVLAVGYDSNRKFLLVRNSWGNTWGQKGYFWMPFSFINSRHCADFWIMQKVKEIGKPIQMKSEQSERERSERERPKRIEKSESVASVASVATNNQATYTFKEDPDDDNEEEEHFGEEGEVE